MVAILSFDGLFWRIGRTALSSPKARPELRQGLLWQNRKFGSKPAASALVKRTENRTAALEM